MPRHGRLFLVRAAVALVAALLAGNAAVAGGKDPGGKSAGAKSAGGKSASAKSAGSKSAGAKSETRCGWFINPTPGNAWLIDPDAQWTVGLQGGHQAEGPWPQAPSEKDWVKHDGDPRGYGYGCACLKVTTGPDHSIARILSAQGKPLAQCRRDRALTALEPDYGSDR